MIRKITCHPFLLVQIILFLCFYFVFSSAYAFNYVSDTFAKISNLPNNHNPLITGRFNNKLEFSDSFSFEANLLLNDDSYIYSLQDRDYVTSARGEGGVSYQGDTFLLSLGMLDSVASSNFYNKLFVIPNYQFGVKSLSRLDSNVQSYYTLMGAHLENNTALSMLYLKSFLDETLYFGVTVTPSMKYSISPNRSIQYQEDKSSVDTTLIYYNEYQDFGYGADVSSRYYFNINDKQDNAQDIAFGFNIDYFGFSFKAHSSLGNNNFALNVGETQNYKAFESSLYYTISNIIVGGYYLNSNIATSQITYKTQILELDLQYKLGENFVLYSAMFYENVKLNNNTGLLLGFSVEF